MDDRKDWYVRRIRHVLLDVVAFSRKDRTADDQVMIIRALNNIVREALHAMHVREEDHILLPTGDGMCICLLVNDDGPDGRHLAFALQVHHGVRRYSAAIGRQVARRFEVRIGLNEHHDCVVKDINGNVNIAGYGINLCQRIMNVCSASQVILGRKAYESLPTAQRSATRFRPYTFMEKHGEAVEVYQLVDRTVRGLDREHPADLLPPPASLPVAPVMRSQSLRSTLTATDQEDADVMVEVPLTDRSVLHYTLTERPPGQAYAFGFHFRTSLNEKGWIGFSSGARPDRIWNGSERTDAATGAHGPGHEIPLHAIIHERWPELNGDPIEITRLRLSRLQALPGSVRVAVRIRAARTNGHPTRGPVRKAARAVVT